jgi:cellulose synthase/poly-beta-1,6-N-acetylglucosamine synthase-like glycosyltransferase
MDFWFILNIIDWILFIPVGGTVLYLGIFSIALLFNRNSVLSRAKDQNRFVIIIPSHKQDRVIEQAVISILSQDYPQRMFDVIVVSDHQSEITNMRLAQYPVTLLTPDFIESTKVKSIQYAIYKLPEFKIYDIALLLDADNIVEQDFLTMVNDAYETAATKAIQMHRISRNRDTAAARMGSIFEEINNNIFRKGHINLGISAALAGSGTAYDFDWFKTNIMKIRSSGEDKELEALLLKQGYFIDYFDNILLYGEKKRTTSKMNEQHGRWTMQQFQNLLKYIRFLPLAILRKQYDWADKLIQWMLLPRTSMVGIIMVMSIILPFIYMTMAIKWWVLGSLALFFFALATPDYLVDEMWDRTFLRSPFVTLWGIISTKILNIKINQEKNEL